MLGRSGTPVRWSRGRVRGGYEAEPGGYTGWVIPGPVDHPLQPRCGFRGPLRCRLLGPPRSKGACLGPGTSESGAWNREGTCRVTDRARRVVPGTAPTQARPSHNQVQTAKRRDFRSIILNLVKTAECHQNMSMRPVIVPVSILGLRSHLLNSSDFHFS